MGRRPNSTLIWRGQRRTRCPRSFPVLNCLCALTLRHRHVRLALRVISRGFPEACASPRSPDRLGPNRDDSVLSQDSSAGADGPRGHTDHGRSSRYIVGDYRIGPYGCPVANRNATQHGHAASNPNLAPDGNRPRVMVCITNLHARHSCMICVPYA
jgi:hypothetical protein